MKIVAAEVVSIPVEGRRWIFVGLHADEGARGWGEASDSGADELCIEAVANVLAPRVLGEEGIPGRISRQLHRRRAGEPLGLTGLPLVTGASAIVQAAWDLHARVLGVPLAALLGAGQGDAVELYANVNRGLRSVDPEDVADAVKGAVGAGFSTVKIAPFRGVRPGHPPDRVAAALSEGLRRIEASLRAVEDEGRLLVDLHGRFDRWSVRPALRALDDLDLGWVEEPCRWEDDPDGLRAARETTSLPIAAGELLPGPRSYRDLLAADVCDVVMADVKHTGGPSAVREVVALCRSAGHPVSLHNPSGPVGTMHSAHLTASTPGVGILELPFAVERRALVEDLCPGAEVVEDGRLRLGRLPGIGIDLDRTVVERVGGTVVEVS